ncbi:hypothetical protein [Sphingomonas sp. R86521]|uniref:hypothetical protein n=1 Tax=Sphingomonas sp. R86521 TaxID=3093860 RepID=UPI0036D3E6D9
MVEIVVTSFVAWLLLAAASYKYRRDLGISAPAMITALRVAAAMLLMLALVRCGAPISGERWVRFLGGSALAAVVLVALLSVVPKGALAQLRTGAMLRARARDPK